MEGYWCYWHGGKGYSGVALHVRKATFPERPAFAHPPFDFETRIAVARLPGLVGRVDLRAQRRQGLPGEDAVPRGDGRLRARGAGRPAQAVVLCGDLNVARTERDVHPKERKPRAIGQLPEERALLERIISRGLVDVGRALDPDNDQLFTWWAPWRNMRQRNIGWRLDYVLASESLASRAVRCPVYREVGTSDHGPVVAELD